MNDKATARGAVLVGVVTSLLSAAAPRWAGRVWAGASALVDAVTLAGGVDARLLSPFEVRRPEVPCPTFPAVRLSAVIASAGLCRGEKSK